MRSSTFICGWPKVRFRQLLLREFAPYGELSEAQLDQLEGHYERLIKWNQKLNLTRIEGIEEAVRFHYGESLYLASKLPTGRLQVMDVGSGAGFPGFPIAVLRPECKVTLVESHQRKAVFLRESARALKNVDVIADRAEGINAAYDWIVARAVRPASVLDLPNSSSFALLVGGSDASGFRESLRIPWGSDRHLVFHVKP